MLASNQIALFNAITIETVSACNRSCWFCKFGQKRHHQNALRTTRMPWKTIHKIIRNLAELDFSGRISWFRINEPLLDNRIFDIIKLTKKNVPKSWVTLITNGDLLTQGKYDQLVKSGLDHLSISIYDDIAFNKVSNLQLKDVIIKDRRAPQAWENRAGNIVQLSSSTQDSDCLRPSTMLSIQSNGDIVLCCADLYGDVVIGSLKYQTLEEVWHSEQIAAYREKLKITRSGLKLCEACDYNGKGHNIHGNTPVALIPALNLS